MYSESANTSRERTVGHPLEELIREAYRAFGRGDVDGYLLACTQDLVFSIPGNGAIAGRFCGATGIHDLARKAFESTGGTFREDVEDVLANDRHAVVLVRHQFTRNGRESDYRSAHIYEVREGKLARCWEQPRDPAAFEEAWSAAP